MYTSCQPCPMCESAIERSGLGRVVFGLSRVQREEIEGAPVTQPSVCNEGPFLLDEARGPVARFFEEHGG